MKKYILFLITVIACNTLQAQLLFSESFDNLTIGNITNDATGTTAGQNGWYTLSFNPLMPNGTIVPVTPASYQIVAEPNKGKVAQIASMHKIGEVKRYLFRTDLNTYWQQRTTGNNVLKIAFDLYTGDLVDDDIGGGDFHMQINSKEGSFLAFGYRSFYSYIAQSVSPKRGYFGDYTSTYALKKNGIVLNFPKKTWVTLECYIDYDNSNVYFSIPSLNYTIVEKVHYKLELGGVDTEGNPKPDDSLTELKFFIIKYMHSNPVNAYSPKIDNINISGQNTVPIVTVGIDDFLAEKFNIYPNPANHVVNITNAENLLVEKITIYNTTGKEINTQTSNNEKELQLNVAHLASGTYMLHIQTNQGTAVKKLVKK